MIKRIKLFVNDNEKSKNASMIIENALKKKGFIIDDNNFDLGIAVGGDGSFLRMIKNTNFNSNKYYVGINSGTLVFLQEIKIDNVNEFINELSLGKYKVEEIGIEETTIYHNETCSKFYSLNEIIVRDKDLKVVRLDIKIDGDLLEKYIGDGILIATSSGSTAHNLSYGGSIVYNTFTSLQITPMAPINSKVYKSLVNSVIIPNRLLISLISENLDNSLIVTVDGDNNFYENVTSIETKIDDKKIKCLRLSHYNFPEKINEKLLSD